MRRGIATALLLACTALSAYAEQLETRKSSVAGVTVAVTPRGVSEGAASWDFKVVLDTHSTDLSDDLAKSSALLDSVGRKHAPVTWEGAPPGGHHREGVLRFKAVSPSPEWIELRIERPSESQPRTFRWELK